MSTTGPCLQARTKKRDAEMAKLTSTANAKAIAEDGVPLKRGRGRPKGAKSKPKERKPTEPAEAVAPGSALAPAPAPVPPSEPRAKRAKK